METRHESNGFILRASSILAGAFAVPLSGAGAAVAQETPRRARHFPNAKPATLLVQGRKTSSGRNSMGLTAASRHVAGYQYSPALKSAGFTWDQASFTDFMQNPRTKVPGNKMAVAGIKDQSEIAAYGHIFQSSMSTVLPSDNAAKACLYKCLGRYRSQDAIDRRQQPITWSLRHEV